MSELIDLIDRMVVEKTFSLDALEVVKKLKEKAEKLESDLKSANAAATNWKQSLDARKAEVLQLQAEIAWWVKRENDLKSRELQITALEQKVAVAEARYWTQNETVSMFLKLPSVRRNITETIGHVVPPSGGLTYPTVYQAQDRTETVETQE